MRFIIMLGLVWVGLLALLSVILVRLMPRNHAESHALLSHAETIA